ncbi:spore cortex-lytic enzyme [Calorimonas adulescens]|jgi:spore cortex-lytic enzyme|uniref:Spore cortex-lytic enzyme n=1 Tax=Calorimonas adulescens TaxID=2606906 RepID=A0A5D8QE94_9THEO|nr:spore cortex-lytic enzyme [Calorimonas adulescens]TZE82875.1 spore cortex-lytic enzyme [Calorimonas adulescens]
MQKRYKQLVLLVIFVITVLIGGVAYSATLSWGSKGSEVLEAQRRLKNWGYYTGPLDGVYGAKMYQAVVRFQKKNGLTPDGVIGNATKRALGMRITPAAATTPSRGISSRDDYTLLARLIHGEARGEPYIGKVAVGAVVLNRVKSSKFPNTISGVIFQPGAFTAVADGQIWLNPDDESLRAARDALNGWDPSGGALYYYNPAKTTSGWIWSRPVITVIGKHRFAR